MVDPNSRLAEFDNQLVGEMRQERTPEPEPDHFFKWLGRTDLAQGAKNKVVDFFSQKGQLESDWAQKGWGSWANVMKALRIDEEDSSGQLLKELQGMEDRGEQSWKALLAYPALGEKLLQKVTGFLIPEASVEAAEKMASGEEFTYGEATMAGAPIAELIPGTAMIPYGKIAKGAAKLADEAVVTGRHWPDYNPLKDIEPKPVGAATVKNQFTNNPTFTTEGEKFIRDNFLKMSDNEIVDVLNQNPEKFLNRIDVANKNTVTGFRDRNDLIKTAKGGADEKGAGGDFQSLTPAMRLRNKNLDMITNNFKSKIGEGKIDINNPDQMYDEFSKIYRSVTGDNRPKLHTGPGHKEYFKYVDEYNKLNPEATIARSEPDLIRKKKKKYMEERGAKDTDKFDEFLRRQFMKAVRKKSADSVDPAFVSNINKMSDNDPMARYLNFIRRTRNDLVDFEKDPNFEIFFSVYDPKDLNTPGSKFYKDFQKFKKLDAKRISIKGKLDPILTKLFPKDTKFALNIAHKFESSKIGDTVQKSKAGRGGDPSEMYIDFNTINVKQQRGLESRARELTERYFGIGVDAGKREDLVELTQIDSILRGYGSEGQVIAPIKDDLGNILYEPGFKIGEAEDNVIRKIIHIAENKGYNFTKKEKEILSEVYDIIKPMKKEKKIVSTIEDLNNGGMVQSMRDGGIIQYFQDGTGEEGVTADQGPISGFDVKPYIPPGARIDEDPLTLGDIGEGIQTTAETAWPYMVPGVGEYLSKKDYEHFTSEAEQALEEGKYPKWLGMTVLGSVALGGTVPNWTVVGAVPNIALGIYKGAKKALTSTPKKIAHKPVVEMEKRYIIKDESGTKVYQTKSPDDADQKVLVLKDKENKNFTVEEIQVAKKVEKPKKTKQELVHVPTVGADDIIGSGDNRLFYSKMDQYMQGTNGNIRVKTGASGNVADIPINEVKLSAKEWHDSLRAAGIKESELVDSYIRQYLNKKGSFTNGKFTNNQPIAYAEIKELLDGSPSKFVQASKYSDADGNLKFADSGRSSGYKNGTREEHVLWMDSKDIRGDVQTLPENVRRYEGHADMRKVETDVNFSANNKLEGEPYVIGWSLVDDRPGKLANGKNVTVTTANEIQSDFLQKAASLKANLKKDLRNTLQAGNTSTAEAIKKQLENIFRQMPLTSAEIKSYTTQIEQASKVFDDVAKMDLNMVDDAVMRQLDDAAKIRDEALTNLNKFIDDIDPKDLFPNIPFKDQKDWVSSLIKNDLAIAAKKRFYFDENGVLQINKSAPSHYSVAPSITQKKRWNVDTNKGMNVPPNQRTSSEHGKAVAYDLEYGGPNVNAPPSWQIVDDSKKIVDIDGNVSFQDGYVVSKGHGSERAAMDNIPRGDNFKIEKIETHFTGNAEETLRKLAGGKNAEFSIGKVKHGGEMVDSFLIELTPEMLTPYIQYFKHGGLVEKIPQYNPLKSVLDVIGPIGAY